MPPCYMRLLLPDAYDAAYIKRHAALRCYGLRRLRRSLMLTLYVARLPRPAAFATMPLLPGVVTRCLLRHAAHGYAMMILMLLLRYYC